MSVNTDNNELVIEMEEEYTLAPSLQLPNVQEMVKINPLDIPKRYLRKKEEMEIGNHMPQLSSEISIIDLTLLSNGNKEELHKLDIACKERGFFQLVNHGVDKELMQNMRNVADEFFKLPLEEKEKYAMLSNDIQGYGHAYVVSQEQILDWTDILFLLIYPTRFRKNHFWPKTPPRFKEIAEAYSSGVKRIAEEILSSLSVLMELEKHTLVRLHNGIIQGLRMNYYPPCSNPEEVLGLSPHSDGNTMTILMQDDDVSGLEIRYKGNWVPVTPMSGALVVNVGDTIEMWSNGKYKSVEHRAMTNKNKKRTSQATFLFPQDDVEIQPFDHMIDSENPKMYQKIKYGDYMRTFLNRDLEGKAHVEKIKEPAIKG